MAEADAAGQDPSVTFHVKSSSGPKYTISVPMSMTTLDLKNKLAGEEYANVPASAQRLIYSGKVLKDPEPLSKYNIKDGNTMHLVRSAASNQRQNPTNSDTTVSATASPAPATGIPQNFAAGTGNDPLVGLTGARYAGFAGMPSLESLAHQPSPEEIARRLEDPNFAQQMNEALQNPQMIDMIINSNPQLRAMGPQARQMLQSDQFRRMMTDPQSMRNMMQMQRMMGGGGAFGAAGQEAFPMPGTTNTTDTAHRTEGQGQPPNQANQNNPFGDMFGGGMLNPFLFPPPTPGTGADNAATGGTQPGAAANPFGALFGLPPQPQGGQAQDVPNPSTNATATAQPQNPFGNYAAMMQNPMMQNMAQQMMQNPEALRNAMQMMFGPDAGGAAGGMNPFAMFGGGGLNQPPDNRPPAERYELQLRQLNEMGFYNFEQNIQALTQSGGDVNGALEWLFSQPAR